MDLEAYLARIGNAGSRAPTRETLAEVVLRHVQSIPFENIDAFLGRRISLDPSAVFAKLVTAGRGGWCFEQNLLLGDALRALGFEVTDLAGRVLWGRPVDALMPRTHRALRVQAKGGDWLVDAGFGGQTITGILDLASDGIQKTPHEDHRLVDAGIERRVEVRIRGEWLPMFRFDLQPQLPVDFEAANFQLVHDPESHFTQRLVVSRVTPEGRCVLRGGELALHDRTGNTTRRKLQSMREVVSVLRDAFGLNLDSDTEAALLRRLDSGAAAQDFGAPYSNSPARS